MKRDERASIEALTSAEQALLGKLCQGLTFRQIDHALQLEAGTAHRMRKPLFRKIGVRTRHQASAVVYPTSHISYAELRQLLEDRYGLTKREGEVLTCLLSFPHLNRKQIGVQLGISDNTTRLTINHMNKKLGVKTRAEAVYRIFTALSHERQPDDTTPKER